VAIQKIEVGEVIGGTAFAFFRVSLLGDDAALAVPIADLETVPKGVRLTSGNGLEEWRAGTLVEVSRDYPVADNITKAQAATLLAGKYAGVESEVLATIRKRRKFAGYGWDGSSWTEAP
jgi:hypothetical protein